MSAEKSLSVDFYKYLCQKIGYEDEVKVRRLTYIIGDLGIQSTKTIQITSGSKGEGLNLNGSDLDIMYIDSVFKVYESDKDVILRSGLFVPLVMDTEDTHPCFTQLHLVNNHDLIFNPIEVIKNSFVGRKFSSELYRLYCMEDVSNIDGEPCTSMVKIHGPCISTATETVDLAWCLKCDKWISQAQPWIIRARTTWPSPDLISNIISCGVLFVPIGYKGSSNENLQWRISFSVAEKCLIFSFNHTQLCYALLKIMIKEIVEKHEDLKNLLCSYFVKTLMFWILEESDPSMWSPDKIIPCFMACLKRLIYCVQYSTLLHYFIPYNNLFYLRFDVDQKEKITSILKNLFEKGISCFARSETLFDIITLHFNVTDLAIRIIGALQYDLKNPDCSYRYRPVNLLYNFVHYSSSKISKSIFYEMLSVAHQNVPQKPQYQPRSNNKHKYSKYKRDLSHLMIGTNSDAVAGWLVLASFFYVHKKYLVSLDIINHALRKCTNEKIYPWQIGLNQNQIYLLHLLKQTEICTILKTIGIKYPNFTHHSPIKPQELQLSMREQVIPLHPTMFAHFLSFLCYYYLHKKGSCKQSMFQLRQTIIEHLTVQPFNSYCFSLYIICFGICYQMIGETHSARKYFTLASKIDEKNLTSAARRLSMCNADLLTLNKTCN